MLLPIIELCRCSPGLVTAMGVSVGLAAGTIMSKGTAAQKERWALDLLTFDKVGAWAITEPDSGSDAFGRMQATARSATATSTSSTGRRPSSRTARTPTPRSSSASSTRGTRPRSARSSRSCSTRACPASSRRSRCARWACTRRRPGCSSSTTCARARTACSARPRTIPYREGAKQAFSIERTGVAAMSLGIIERCLELCIAYAKETRPVRQADRRPPAHPGEARPDGGAPPQHREPRVPVPREGHGGGRRWTSPRPRR